MEALEADGEWLSRFPLRVQVFDGRGEVVDAAGEPFVLQAVNWFGASDVAQVVGGLEVRPLRQLCETVRDLGFNGVRLPFSNEMLRRHTPAQGAERYCDARLRTLRPLRVLDEVLRELARCRVVVVLNNHTSTSTWSGGPDGNGLWFRPGYDETSWREDGDDRAALRSLVSRDRLRPPQRGSAEAARTLAADGLEAAMAFGGAGPSGEILRRRRVAASCGELRQRAPPERSTRSRRRGTRRLASGDSYRLRRSHVGLGARAR